MDLRTRTALLCSVIGIAAAAQGEFLIVDFEGGGVPPAFDIGPAVERLGPDGQGLGEFVPAWRVLNAEESDAGGFFPVPDEPVGNRFIAAVDDAFPCDCDMAEVSLTISPPSFVGRARIALECRIFHEGTLGSGDALLEARTGGGEWTVIDTLPVLHGEWQRLSFDLSAYDGTAGTQLRFRWSDNGTWSSGFAVDDIVLRERAEHDLAVARAFTHDPGISPFTPGNQSLRYSRLPLAQSAPFTVAVEVVNRGSEVLDGITASVTITLNAVPQGPFTAASPEPLAPGAYRMIPIPTGWVPDDTGPVEVTIEVAADQTDERPENNSGTTGLLISGPGWDLGYGAMARDENIIQGVIGGQQVFIAANRLELVASGTVTGISAVISSASAEGTTVRGILFDANLALIDTTERHTLSADDLAGAALGEPLFLAFPQGLELVAGDVIAGVQHADTNGLFLVHTSGNSPLGAALYLRGTFLDVDYVRATPMVRLHFDAFGVGVEETVPEEAQGLLVFPLPTTGPLRLRYTLAASGHTALLLTDMAGRTVRSIALGVLPAGPQEQALDLTGLTPGTYLLRLRCGGQRMHGRVVLTRP